jgi:hypothetical protein
MLVEPDGDGLEELARLVDERRCGCWSPGRSRWSGPRSRTGPGRWATSGKLVLTV